MIIYPAIDLIDGCCVRLQQGDFARQTDYAIAADDLARQYATAGAEWLHVVDLDAARGRNDQLPVISKLTGIAGLQVQSGGGVRNRDDIRQRLQAGVARVIVGSVCVRQPLTFIDWLHEFGAGRLVAALDVRAQDVRAHDAAAGQRWLPAVSGWEEDGWKEDCDSDLFSLLQQLAEAGLQHLLCTDIGRDGMLGGPNLKLYAQIREQFPDLQLQASGGVHALSDMAALRELDVAGVIIGKALLEGRFTLREALVCP